MTSKLPPPVLALRVEHMNGGRPVAGDPCFALLPLTLDTLETLIARMHQAALDRPLPFDEDEEEPDHLLRYYGPLPPGVDPHSPLAEVARGVRSGEMLMSECRGLPAETPMRQNERAFSAETLTFTALTRSTGRRMRSELVELGDLFRAYARWLTPELGMPDEAFARLAEFDPPRALWMLRTMPQLEEHWFTARNLPRLLASPEAAIRTRAIRAVGRVQEPQEKARSR